MPAVAGRPWGLRKLEARARSRQESPRGPGQAGQVVSWPYEGTKERERGFENRPLQTRRYPASSFWRALPLPNHGRSTLRMYLGNVLFLAANFCAHSRASSFFPASFRKFA